MPAARIAHLCGASVGQLSRLTLEAIVEIATMPLLWHSIRVQHEAEPPVPAIMRHMVVACVPAIAVLLSVGCGRSGPTSPTASGTDGFVGTWQATAITGPCSELSYIVSRDGAGLRVNYTTGCGTQSGAGSAGATVVTGTLVWSTTSTPTPCGRNQLNFTARAPAVSSSSELTYAGTLCDGIVAGTATMTRVR